MVGRSTVGPHYSGELHLGPIPIFLVVCLFERNSALGFGFVLMWEEKYIHLKCKRNMNWFFCSRWLDAAPWAPIIVSGQGSPSAAASRVLLCNRPTQYHSFGEIQSLILFPWWHVGVVNAALSLWWQHFSEASFPSFFCVALVSCDFGSSDALGPPLVRMPLKAKVWQRRIVSRCPSSYALGNK